MKYVSTRAGSAGEAAPIGFLDAVLAGLAPDGGLYLSLIHISEPTRHG